MCKDRTTSWGYGKTIRKGEYEKIIEKQAKGDRTEPVIRGKRVKPQAVKRYMKRRKIESHPPAKHLAQEASAGQATASSVSSHQQSIASHLAHDELDQVPGLSPNSTLTGDTALERAAEQLAALADDSDTVDTIQVMSSIGEDDYQSPLSVEEFPPEMPLTSLLVTPAWPRSPPCHIADLEGWDVSELSFADSFYTMNSVLNGTNDEDLVIRAKRKDTYSHLASGGGQDKESLAQASIPPVAEEVSDTASRWISFCSLAAMQHPNGKSEVLHHHLREANCLFEEMVRKTDQHLLSSIVIFAAILEAHGKDDSVRTLLSHTSVSSRGILGSRHCVTVTITWMVDMLSKDNRKTRFSLSKLREVAYTFEGEYGKHHPYYPTSLFNLAKALDLENYAEEAEPLLREVVEICPKVFAKGHPQTIVAQMNLARVLIKNGESTGAHSVMASAISSSHERWGLEHPYTLECLRRKAILLELLKQPEEIEALLLMILKGRVRTLGLEHRFTNGSRLDLESWLGDHGKKHEASSLGEKMRAWSKEASKEGIKNGLASY
jgi:hypothetical protein